MAAMDRTCYDCKRVLPIADFPWRRTARDGTPRYDYRCKSCQSAYLKEWKARNRERLAEAKARYYRENTERQKAWGGNHRAKRSKAGEMTVEEHAAVMRLFGGCCAYCGEANAGTIDHVTPLSRGGSHSVENALPSCAACNCAKGRMTPLEWFLTRPDAYGRRLCWTCGSVKPIEAFTGFRSGKITNRRTPCLECTARRFRERWHAMPREERAAITRRYQKPRDRGHAAPTADQTADNPPLA